MTAAASNAFSLVCLGTGKGASYVMRGVTSTALALLHHDRPIVLIDCGAGVVLSCLKHLGTIPQAIVVTHNHMDHTGDLNVVLHSAKTPYSLYGQGDVLDLVKLHRLHDGEAAMAAAIALHQWHAAQADAQAPHGRLHILIDGQDSPLMLTLVPAQHGYLCFGFVAWWAGAPLFAYSADTGYVESIYTQLSAAPRVIVDGRETSSRDHASFEEIEAYARRTPSVRYDVVHHEDATHSFAAPNVSLLREGQRIALGTLS
jgi:phosphoribosyl 1,2-cyclic phosphodiesterase